MEVKVFKVGDRVDQMCLTCNKERGHVVLSLSKAGKITRVSCPVCETRAPFRGGATAASSTAKCAPYDRTRTYRKGDMLMHSMFGAGEVTAIIEPRKMDVLFADRMRRLLHSNA